MRGADENVASLHGVNCLSCRGNTGVSCRDERCDNAYGLCVLHESLLRDGLDDAYALLSEAVPKDQLQLIALVTLCYLVAESGLVNGFVANRPPNFQRVKCCTDCAAKMIYSLLIVSRDNFCCGSGLLHHLFKHGDFFGCYFMMCHCYSFTPLKLFRDV